MNEKSIYCYECDNLKKKDKLGFKFYYCKLNYEFLRTIPMSGSSAKKFPVKSLTCIERLNNKKDE